MATLCDNCGGALLYSPKRHGMYCRMCGKTFKAEEVEESEKESLIDKKIRSFSEVYGADDKEYYDCKVYSCNHCGADIILNGTETSTVCIYCGSPNVVFSRVLKQHKPDGIIPFSVTKADASAIIKGRINSSHFVPGILKKMVPDDIKGIYIPYWVLNADFYGAYLIEASEGSGKYERTYYYGKAASCEFRSLPFDASVKLNDDLSVRLEPYIFEDAKVFDEDYLSGFYSDCSDLSSSGLRTAALKRMDTMMADEIMSIIPGHDKHVLDSFPYVDIHNDSVYLLLPAWFYSFEYDNKPYTIMINGQTGKMVGFLPVDKKKVILFSLLILIMITGAFCLPTILWDPYILMFFFSSFSTAFILLAIPPIAYSVRAIKRLLNYSRASRSKSTFMYAKNRQV